jgi:L-ribulose-5-phosphate 4-epimerase
MATELDDVKRQVAIANRVLAEVGLASGVLATLGHASMRVPGDPDKFVVKGRGYTIDALAKMTPDDMVVVDLEGNKVGGPENATQCFEVKMHSCLYRTRPDVMGVVHAHPRYTVIMGILGATLVPMCNEGLELVRKPLPVWPHNKIILSDEEGMEVVEAMGDGQAVLLFGHGATTSGASVDQAVMNMWLLEEQARMNWIAYCAAGPNHAFIPEDLIEEGKNRPQLPDLPHFADSFGAGKVRANVNGNWMYYSDKVTKDLDRELAGA